jgi:fructoselysine-6-P-deglycase FrlB-like protein
MASIQYWVDTYARDVETYLYFPAEFIRQAPRRIDEKSLAILVSDSGKTSEVIEAARFIRNTYPCEMISFTSRADSPLAQETRRVIPHGEGPVGFEAKFMLLLAFVSAWMQGRGEWELHNQIMEGLSALPGAMAEAEELAEPQNRAWAGRYQNEDFYIVTGSGPCYPVSYSLGVCIMMEALWIKVF